MPQPCPLIRFLSNHDLFQNLYKGYLRYLKKYIIIESFEANRLVCTNNQREKYFYIIKKGTIKIIHMNGKGQNQVIDLLTKKDHFGEMNLFGHTIKNLDLYYYTHTDTVIYKIEYKRLKKVLALLPEFKKCLHQSLCKKIEFLHNLLINNAYSNLNKRIAHSLLFLLFKFGKQTIDGSYIIQLKVTHRLLSEMVGTSRESITKAFRSLKKMGIVSFRNNKTLLVPDIGEIKNLAQK